MYPTACSSGGFEAKSPSADASAAALAIAGLAPAAAEETARARACRKASDCPRGRVGRRAAPSGSSTAARAKAKSTVLMSLARALGLDAAGPAGYGGRSG